MGTVDINSLNVWELWKIVRHDVKNTNATDAYTIDNSVDRLPSDQSFAVLKAIANNYKQACLVRDEVAMSRFGSDTTYAWLSYPPLTWSDTPGQNSWSSLTFTNNPPTTAVNNNGDTMIAMSDDNSRPMRMVMSHHAGRDIDYDRAVWILGSGLSDIETAALREVFHPNPFDPATYTNEELLDSVIRVIEANATMTDHLDRYAWYNHFDQNYYGRHHMDW